MKTIITLIVAVAFTLGSLFAFSDMSSTDADEVTSKRPLQKTQKASAKKAILDYDFEFFSN